MSDVAVPVEVKDNAFARCLVTRTKEQILEELAKVSDEDLCAAFVRAVAIGWRVDDLDSYFHYEVPEDRAAGLRDDTLERLRASVVVKVSCLFDGNSKNMVTWNFSGRWWQIATWPSSEFDGMLLLRELGIQR